MFMRCAQMHSSQGHHNSSLCHVRPTGAAHNAAVTATACISAYASCHWPADFRISAMRVAHIRCGARQLQPGKEFGVQHTAPLSQPQHAYLHVQAANVTSQLTGLVVPCMWHTLGLGNCSRQGNSPLLALCGRTAAVQASVISQPFWRQAASQPLQSAACSTGVQLVKLPAWGTSCSSTPPQKADMADCASAGSKNAL